MHSLPSKPWKKVEVVQRGENHYLIKFLSPLKDEDHFREIIQDDLEPCLNEHSTFENSDWETRTVTLRIEDYRSFKRRLVFQGVMIEEERLNKDDLTTDRQG